MDWIERLNQAMKYIEEHLGDDIDFHEIEKITLCSSYHFQRMFNYMAELPLSEYIRRRKMSLAAVELQDEKNKVIEIALKYGYQSPTAFTRAFLRIHGVTPTQAREQGMNLKAYPPMSFHISIKGDTAMEYRIEKKKAFRIIGASTSLEKELEKNFESVPMFWGKCVTDGTIETLGSKMDGEIKGLLGISVCQSETDWKYYIAVASNQPANGMEEYIIPETTWAIFSGRGDNASIQELEKRIVLDWLPTSGYEYGNAPDVEVYYNADPKDSIYEVWLPVVKK